MSVVWFSPWVSCVQVTLDSPSHEVLAAPFSRHWNNHFSPRLHLLFISQQRGEIWHNIKITPYFSNVLQRSNNYLLLEPPKVFAFITSCMLFLGDTWGVKDLAFTTFVLLCLHVHGRGPISLGTQECLYIYPPLLFASFVVYNLHWIWWDSSRMSIPPSVQSPCLISFLSLLTNSWTMR